MLEQPTPQKRRSRWPTIAPPEVTPPSRKYEPWTPAEDKLLRKTFGKKGTKHTALLLGRTIPAVNRRAQQLQVRGWGRRQWRPAEIKYMINRYKDRTAVQIARALNRSEQSVRHQLRKQGLTVNTEQMWSSNEDKYLREHHGKNSIAEIAAALNRSVISVTGRTGRLGLQRHIAKLSAHDIRYILEHVGTVPYTELEKKFGIDARRIKRVVARGGNPSKTRGLPWTAEEDVQLREFYGKIPLVELGERVKRTSTAVGGRAQVLGIMRKKGNVKSKTGTNR